MSYSVGGLLCFHCFYGILQTWDPFLQVLFTLTWRSKWQPTPTFLPGKSHKQRSLAGYSPWVSKRWTLLSMQHSLIHFNDHKPGRKEFFIIIKNYFQLHQLTNCSLVSKEIMYRWMYSHRIFMTIKRTPAYLYCRNFVDFFQKQLVLINLNSYKGCVCVCARALSHAQLFMTPMNCNPPGSSVQGITLARILEWVAIFSSRGSFQHRD